MADKIKPQDLQSVDEIVQKNAKGEAVTTSRIVAKKFGIRHDNVLQAIENLQKKRRAAGLSLLNFQERDYIDSRGKTYRMYLMDRKALFNARRYCGHA